MSDTTELYATAIAPKHPTDISVVVGENLRRIRTRNGLTLERLARASGVSRAMLGQIELGRSAPTINVLWKIARALDVPLTAFTSATSHGGAIVLRAHRSSWQTSWNGNLVSRTLFPSRVTRRDEFLELKVAPQSQCEGEPFPPGTTVSLVVAKGMLDLVVGDEDHRLVTGDAIYFQADQRHHYKNSGAVEAVLYVLRTYPDLRHARD